MAKVDPEILRHKEWLGLLQPVGLVVAPVALVKGQAVPSKNVAEQQRTLIEVTGGTEGTPKLDFERFALEVLEWQPDDLVGAGGSEVPSDLDVALTEYREVLSPSFAVPDPAEAGKWLVLVKTVEDELDRATDSSKQGWHTSPQIRFERLLRDNDVPIGLLANAESVRLVYAPTGESSGHLTFPISAMREVAGRPILAALLMLLGSDRLFTLPDDRRLPTLLAESRKYQNVVSTELSQQVLRALGELLRGFQVADNAMNGDLLHDAMREDPQHVYGGLITVLMRLVFLLYAEERDLLPGDDVYQEHYSVTGLFEKLRADAALYPDTMDQRYGAWARLLSLFRLIFDGGQHGSMRLPAREGQLFHPDEYPFLEGRAYRSVRQLDELLTPPRVSDGTVYRVLEDLLVLDGERLSYRTLDVEQIGSVYEAIMGFEVRRAMAPSIALRPEHVVVNLQQLLDAKPAQRVNLLKAEANCSIPKGASKGLKNATTVDDVVNALSTRISPQTPTVLPLGALFLQPTEERRRSGSHYTPRALTAPILRTALRPVLDDLGANPTPEQILGLKICDPAMGSGAFLVEACRHLADRLVDAWAAHDSTPVIPPDEDAVLHARRLVAQRCLYGVDKNPFAVSLARLSLWLVTLARDHSFTFIDHALKHGDSLVGLTRKQIAAFHWDEAADQNLPILELIARNIGKARAARSDIFALGDEDEAAKRLHHREAEEALQDARLTGDLVVSAFFSSEKQKAREGRRQALWKQVQDSRQDGGLGAELRGVVDEMREAASPVIPFHWEVEFPEAFDRAAPGFDAFVGNPPFAGVVTLARSVHASYTDYLRASFPESGGKTDVVAFFFRRCFEHLRDGGSMGLLATKTVAQGDTRISGLYQIVRSGGSIYAATRRLVWPGKASVIVSVVYIHRGDWPGKRTLDGASVPVITSYLLTKGGDEEPSAIPHDGVAAYLGCKPGSKGFIFSAQAGPYLPLAERERLLDSAPACADVVRPYLGGKEFNEHPEMAPIRWIIDFGEMTLDDAGRYPAALRLVETHVRPGVSRDRWWQFSRSAKALTAAKSDLKRMLVIAETSDTFALGFVDAATTVSNKIVAFTTDSMRVFSLLQSRIHEVWARTFSSTMKDDLSYVPSDCFDTFPFPADWQTNDGLQESGSDYYVERSQLLADANAGLTAAYNRFHSPDENSAGIQKLRALHDNMDRAVLDAYSWDDIRPTCEFILDYEEEDHGESTRRKKPWRYRWPDAVQEEVLARLLDLNRRQGEAPRQPSTTARARTATLRTESDRPSPETRRSKKGGRKGSGKSKKRQRTPASDSQIKMFTEDIE